MQPVLAPVSTLLPPPPSSLSLYSRLCSLYEPLCDNVMALSNVFVWSLYHDYEWPDIPHRALNLFLNDMFDAELRPPSGRWGRVG